MHGLRFASQPVFIESNRKSRVLRFINQLATCHPLAKPRKTMITNESYLLLKCTSGSLIGICGFKVKIFLSDRSESRFTEVRKRIFDQNDTA
jgi:hypothetical protein